mmetsp:Transcript_22638/g.70295  ORF Transcript_22638/g.70295 Transcript_22638/m.70295 type:complete len:423 (-) Transcript_22638:1546-2814(-)
MLLELGGVLERGEGLRHRRLLLGVLCQRGAQQVRHGGIRALLPPLLPHGLHHWREVAAEHLEALVVEVEAVADEHDDDLAAARQEGGVLPEALLALRHLPPEAVELLEGALQERVQVAQGRGVAVLEPHQQPLLDGAKLVRALGELVLELRAPLALGEVIVDEHEEVLQGQRLLEGHGEGLLARRVHPLEVRRQPLAELLRHQPDGLERAGLQAIPAACLGHEDGDVVAAVVLEGQHVGGGRPRHEVRSVRGLHHHVLEERGELRRHPRGVQGDLVPRVLHRGHHLAREAQRDLHLAVRSARLPVVRGVGRDNGDLVIRGQAVRARVDGNRDDDRRPLPTRERGEHHRVLAARERPRDAEGDVHTLDRPLARVADEEAHGDRALLLPGPCPPVLGAPGHGVEPGGHLPAEGDPVGGLLLDVR